VLGPSKPEYAISLRKNEKKEKEEKKDPAKTMERA